MMVARSVELTTDETIEEITEDETDLETDSETEVMMVGVMVGSLVRASMAFMAARVVFEGEVLKKTRLVGDREEGRKDGKGRGVQ